MGLFQKIKGAFNPKGMGSAELERLILSGYGGGTNSGVSVTSDTAMRLMTVHACVKVLYESIAQLPFHLMETDGDKKAKAKTHPLYRILHDTPNQWMTAPEFWGMCVAHLALRGNFYAFKAGLPGRGVRGLIPIKFGAVEEVEQKEDFSLVYRVRNPKTGERKDYSQEEIFHVRGITVNGYTGINPIQEARESIGLGLAGEQFLSRYFSSGMHPGAIIKHPKILNDQTRAALKGAFEENYAGLGKSHNAMLIEDGMDAVFPPIKLVDAQFLELAKLTQSQICGIFRVPLMLVQAGDAPTTYASAEQFMLAFVTHALTPIVVNIEKAVYRDLLTDEEKDKHFAKFEMRGLLRGAFKEQMEGLQTAVNTEIINPNEARDILDMNPYPGGDEYRTRTSTVKQQAPATGEAK